MDVCTCLLTALLAGSNFPDIVGGITAQCGCGAGTFSYRGHDLVLHYGPKGKQTHIHIPIPHLPERTVLSYCWGNNVAAIGATQVPVAITSDELLV